MEPVFMAITALNLHLRLKFMSYLRFFYRDPVFGRSTGIFVAMICAISVITLFVSAGAELVADYLTKLISGKNYTLNVSQLAFIAGASLFQVDKSQLENIACDKLEQFVR